MRLSALYNVFDGDELLEGSINCLKGEIDLLVIVYQTTSNFGEEYKPKLPIPEWVETILVPFKPLMGTVARVNEKAKRNLGIEVARSRGCTHFLHLDVDEYYENFAAAKQAYIASGYEGSVCKIFTYFKKPIWRFERTDNYYVPFIHQLTETTRVGNTVYTYYVDPTRGVNTDDIVELDVVMHHFSWVRLDINRKIRNSTAVHNILRTTLLDDYNDPELGPGSLVKDYQNMHLVEVSNMFNINV